MKRNFISTPACPLTELELCTWIGEATPGDILQYHRGFLALDTTAPTLSAAQQKTLRLLARRARWASEQGLVHLVQRRAGPNEFAYLAIKRRSQPPRPRNVPPAQDEAARLAAAAFGLVEAAA